MRKQRAASVVLGVVGTIAVVFGIAISVASAECATSFVRKFGESTGSGYLWEPRDVAIDSEGNAWVADTRHNRVQKFNSGGEFVVQFNVESEPTSIAIDPEGHLWISSSTKIREYKTSGELLLSFGESGTGNGQFKLASGIAIDPSGNVWVVDRSLEALGTGKSRVQKFNSKGEYLSQFGKEGTGNGEFAEPSDIAIDSEGNIVIADTFNNRIQEFSATGEYVRQYSGEGENTLEKPRGIAVDAESKVWVADSGHNRIERFSAKGTFLSKFGSSGAGNGQFSGPRGLAVSGSNVWVADTGNGRVQEFNFAGEYSRSLGLNAAGQGRLAEPRDVAIDSKGNAWVADTGHSRVQEFNASGEFVSQFNVTTQLGTAGVVNGLDLDAEGNVWIVGKTEFWKYKQNGELIFRKGNTGSGNGQFESAQGIAMDGAGNAWIVDSGLSGKAVRVQKFNAKGEYLSQFGKEGVGNGEFKEPQAIALDSEGNILVADTGNNRYQEFNSAGVFVRKVGTEGTGNGQFKSPRGITVDSEGKVWVTDSGNNRIERFSAKGAYLSQFGVKGPNDGQFNEPRGITVSGSNIWVADMGNSRVQELSCL